MRKALAIFAGLLLIASTLVSQNAVVQATKLNPGTGLALASVTHAAANPFDKSAVVNAPQTQNSTANLTTVSIMPSMLNEITSSVTSIAWHTLTNTVTGGNGHTPRPLFSFDTKNGDADSSCASTTPPSILDEDNGWVYYINTTDTTAITSTYSGTQDSGAGGCTGNPTGVLGWDSGAISFKSKIYTAATCNFADVNALINGPGEDATHHVAVNGDVIQIPAGTCTWTTPISGITVSGKGITIQGTGTPNSTTATTGASASCTQTNITLFSVVGFSLKPTYGNATMRLSCMQLNQKGSSLATVVQGTCTASGCPNIRLDNLTLPSNWVGGLHNPSGGGNSNSYGVTAIGNVFGVIDHNSLTGSANNYLQFMEFGHSKYLGINAYGDNSWAQPESYGSGNFIFVENNLFTTSGVSENETTYLSDLNAGGQGGGRVVVRFNSFANMDNLNSTMSWHGTESSGRPRGARAFEYYKNTYACTGSCDQVAGPRSGTGLAWGNTVSHASGSLNNFFALNTYRSFGSISEWNPCDGSTVYDTNDGVIYCDGTISGGVVTCTSGSVPANPPAGSPYSLHDITANNGKEIASFSGNAVNLRSGGGGPGEWGGPANGDHVQILRASACIDQAGGRGAGALYSTDPPNSVSSAEVLSPAYFWLNTINSGSPIYGVQGINSDTGRVIRSRDFYVEDINQAQQNSPTSPFDGGTSKGIGHGALRYRPTTCKNGVGYWATDSGPFWNNGTGQGQLFLCSGGSWSTFYTPYTYPHPLIGGTVAAAPSAPVVQLSASTLTFASQNLNTTSASQQVHGHQCRQRESSAGYCCHRHSWRLCDFRDDLHQRHNHQLSFRNLHD